MTTVSDQDQVSSDNQALFVKKIVREYFVKVHLTEPKLSFGPPSQMFTTLKKKKKNSAWEYTVFVMCQNVTFMCTTAFHWGSSLKGVPLYLIYLQRV